MAIIRNLFWTLMTFYLFGCGVNQPTIISEGATPTPLSGDQAFFSGELLTTDQKTIDLSELKNKPTVIAFASITCSSCWREAQSFKGALESPSVPPEGIHLLHVLVGASLEEATQWKKAAGLPWDVGVDPDLSLFNNYCGGNMVPCVVAQTPKEGISFKHVGELTAEELMNVTGDWGEAPTASPKFFAGKITTVQGEEINFESLDDKPTVLMFASKTCASCSEVAQAIKSSLNRPEESPDQVNLITLLVDATNAEANEWAEREELPWTVAIDKGQILFNQYCEEKTTPCLVAQKPAQGIGLRHSGRIELEKLTAYAGPLESKKGDFVSGTVTLISGESLDLDSLGDKPTVLIFASKTCASCWQEAQDFKASLSDPTAAPSKINMVSLLVDAKPEQAKKWADRAKLPWTVGLDVGGALHRKYCESFLTPCIVAQKPAEGIGFKHVGETTVEELKTYTGEWE